MNTTPADQDSPTGAVALGRGWLWPAVLVTALLTLSYLPGHDARDGLDVLASTVAALGLLALSVALPRAARSRVLGDHGPLVLFGATGPGLDRPDRPVRRRLLAIGASVGVSAVALWVSALMTASLPVERSAHAVSLILVSVNIWLLLSNLVTAPPFGGWSFLLAMIDAVGTAPHRRLVHARRLGRVGVLAVSVLLGAWAAVIGHPMLLFGALVLAWYGWIAPAMAVADDAISRFLGRRRVGDLLRPVATQFDTRDLVAEVASTLPPNGVALVFRDAGLAGAIGPRQVAHLSPEMNLLRCGQAMVPIDELSMVSATAPAVDLLPHLGRHGFVVVWAGAGFGYVEEHDLRERIVIAADMRRRVQEAESRDTSGRP